MEGIAESPIVERTDPRRLGSVEGVLKNATFYYVGGAISALSRLVIVALIARGTGAEGYGPPVRISHERLISACISSFLRGKRDG